MKIHQKHSIKPVPRKELCLANVYVWEWPVRLTHWITAISIWVLSITGIYIGSPDLLSPGQAGEHFLMGYAKLIHYYAAIAFTLSVLSRLAWMFMGNRYSRWDKFIPVRKARLRQVWPTIKYYLFALRLPPGYVGHNPLAGLTYFFLFIAFLMQIGTGLALYSMSAHLGSPLKVFSVLVPVFGGLQTARLIHHVIMWLIWAFFVHHVYSAILMSQVEPTATVESIFSGHKFVATEEVASVKSRYHDERTAARG